MAPCLLPCRPAPPGAVCCPSAGLGVPARLCSAALPHCVPPVPRGAPCASSGGRPGGRGPCALMAQPVSFPAVHTEPGGLTRSPQSPSRAPGLGRPVQSSWPPRSHEAPQAQVSGRPNPAPLQVLVGRRRVTRAGSVQRGLWHPDAGAGGVREGVLEAVLQEWVLESERECSERSRKAEGEGQGPAVAGMPPASWERREVSWGLRRGSGSPAPAWAQQFRPGCF